MKAKRYTKREIKKILGTGHDLQSWPLNYEEIKTANSWEQSLKNLMVRSRTSRISKWIDSVVRAGSNRGRNIGGL